MATKKKKNTEDKVERDVYVPKSAAQLQKIRLDKLMKNPEKQVFIPDRPEEKQPKVFSPPEFIRNIWGSSAGAGSGDFHVYRGVRRREYARQKHLDQQQAKDELDAVHEAKMAENEKKAMERTAKKRLKRQKKKMKQKAKKVKTTLDNKSETKNASESDSDEKSESDEES